MIATTIIGAAALATSTLSPGVGYAARKLAKKMEEERTRLQQTCSWGAAAETLSVAILKLREACCLAGWDGYDALPASNESLSLGIRLAKSLPWGYHQPTVGVEPDGQLTFEWYKSPRRICSVSVAPDGTLHYAALIGASKVYGSEPFNGTLPPAIINVIDSVYS